MGTTKKTDNRYLNAKLILRRHFLSKYHSATPPTVIDCCQGSGKIWGILMKDTPVQHYWPMDKKPKKGRLAIDSCRVIESGHWKADVLDVDTYGSPWGHWFGALKTAQGPLTVFLTVGLIRVGGGGMMANGVKEALGLSKLEHQLGKHGLDKVTIKASLLGKLHDFSVEYCLRKALTMGWTVVECQEALPSDKARYFGVRLAKLPLTIAAHSATST